MSKIHTFISLFLIVLAAGCFSGCSGNASVTGLVKFDDGTPLTIGEVIFESSTLEARGPINSSGKYAMETNKAGDGIPPGQYRVYIGGAVEATGKDISVGARGDSRPEMRPVIDEKFTQPATSGLTCDVKGSQKFDITVSKPSN